MEYILCAANHYFDGKEYEHQPFNIPSRKGGFVVCGWRHHNIIAQVAQLLGKKTIDHRNRFEGGKVVDWDKEIPAVQGFLTNKNRFVTREEAARIAYKAGQIEEEKGYLTSEDIY